jgi:hypothetical protein
MKTPTYPALGLAVLCAAGLCTQARAGIFSNNFNMLVVAEQLAAPAQQDNPSSYVAIDGGYIEAGDSLAGDTPPTADQIRQDLQAALSEHSFQAAQGTPSVVLAYYWGILRVDHRQIKVPYGIKSNLMARIELVSTVKLGEEVENHILLREKGSGTNEDVSSPVILAGSLETVQQDARMPRMFIVVSAYDYQALVHREAKVLWRVKLSALDTSGEMREVLPALIAGGAPYFGKNLTDLRDVEVSLSTGSQATLVGASARPTLESLQLDKQFVGSLLRQERGKISGLGAYDE